MTPAETAAFCIRCLNHVCVLGGLIRIYIILNLKEIWEELESQEFCSEGVLVPVSPQNCPKGRTKGQQNFGGKSPKPGLDRGCDVCDNGTEGTGEWSPAQVPGFVMFFSSLHPRTLPHWQLHNFAIRYFLAGIGGWFIFCQLM